MAKPPCAKCSSRLPVCREFINALQQLSEPVMKEADPNLHANRVAQACVEKNGAVRVHRNAPRRNIVLATQGVLSAFMLLLCPLAYSQTSLSGQQLHNTAGG